MGCFLKVKSRGVVYVIIRLIIFKIILSIEWRLRKEAKALVVMQMQDDANNSGDKKKCTSQEIDYTELICLTIDWNWEVTEQGI